IPKIERAAPKPPPIMLEDGALLCPRHPESFATFRCTHCHEVMCGNCVRMMRFKGGKPLFLCTVCHNKCERIGDQKPVKKKGFFALLQGTVKLKFKNPRGKEK
ncbi:MAG TPA: B-box zinc finger protein, partial [Verrucomicrobiae bacterium]